MCYIGDRWSLIIPSFIRSWCFMSDRSIPRWWKSWFASTKINVSRQSLKSGGKDWKSVLSEEMLQEQNTSSYVALIVRDIVRVVICHLWNVSNRVCVLHHPGVLYWNFVRALRPTLDLWVNTWFFKLNFWVNFSPQILHMNGSLSSGLDSWVDTWFFKWTFWVNFSHKYPIWMNTSELD